MFESECQKEIKLNALKGRKFLRNTPTPKETRLREMQNLRLPEKNLDEVPL